ncbi:MAG: hypothetical protein DRH24_05630 [Deltaproteobacteria bacterium]|nr:MAG: hypothetical protein DRH24_05630 [Deltaproteobacteria bacterium]
MKQIIRSVVVATFVSIILVACSGENKPPTSEMKAALTQSIPGHVELNSFSIQASQNFGNKVEPIYGSRFNSTVTAMVDLYKIDKKDKGITFARLVTKRGKQTEVFGKITSKLYQGAWKHNIDIDGSPIRNLGLPLNQIPAGRVIVRGSDEEKNYYAEIERKEKERRIERERKAAELRENILNARKILIGSWRDENSISEFKLDGTVHTKWDDGYEQISKWHVENDLIIKTYLKKKKNNSDWETSQGVDRSNLIYIDENKYIIKDKKGKKWSAKRIN